jgi:hypothetical protein
MMSRISVRRSLGLALTLVAWLGASPALAESTIKHPGDHPDYVFEAEPHLILAPLDPPYDGRSTGLGVGFRGTVQLLHNGFIPKINNSVGIGFGLDWAHYQHDDARGYCTHYETLSATRVCTEVNGSSGGFAHNYVFLPVVLQWNFWFDPHWSAFAEPGFAFVFHEHGTFDFEPFVFYLGGRYHFNDRIALTMRVGYPTFSLGASFLF